MDHGHEEGELSPGFDEGSELRMLLGRPQILGMRGITDGIDQKTHLDAFLGACGQSLDDRQADFIECEDEGLDAD